MERTKMQSAERKTWTLSTRVRFLARVMSFSAFVLSCSPPGELTEQKAQEIIHSNAFKHEPIYAEVPQRVWWSPAEPKDEYDEKALRTMANLERAGLVTLHDTQQGVISAKIAKITQKGFPILGTAPSFRGAVFRGRICEKIYDGLQKFERHPTEKTTGHAELVWHYDNPTWLYPLFETKINKPLKKPFASLISFYFKDHQWRFDVTVRKTEAQ